MSTDPAPTAAGVLIDPADLDDLTALLKDRCPESILWFPVGFLSMWRLGLRDAPGRCYFPRLADPAPCDERTESLYKTTQSFLATIQEEDPAGDYPLSYFWHCLVMGAYRLLAYCDDLVRHIPVSEVFLIERRTEVNEGGLLIPMAAFTTLIHDFFTERGIPVTRLAGKPRAQCPTTLFYDQPDTWRAFAAYVLGWLRWLSHRNRAADNRYLLVKPAYDNTMVPGSAWPSGPAPQVYHGRRMPFLRSFGRTLRWWHHRRAFNLPAADGTAKTDCPRAHTCRFFGCRVDLARLFSVTIERYRSDTRFMAAYVDAFWRCCLPIDEAPVIIFSLPPVHMDAFFMIRQARARGCRVAVWQHGGFYGYAPHFLQFVTDYRHADYFLSYGTATATRTENGPPENPPEIVAVGSRALFTGPRPARRRRPAPDAAGLYLPVVVGEFYSQGRLRWDARVQLDATRRILEYFGSGTGGRLVVKGLKNHPPHLEIAAWIHRYAGAHIRYSDVSTITAISRRPAYVVIDNPSTPLLQVLTQYAGPVFLMINQESWALAPSALALLRRRVVYSRSAEELEGQLDRFFQSGDLGEADPDHDAFIRAYARRFAPAVHDAFLNKAVASCRP